jgi:hypothetical protein
MAQYTSSYTGAQIDTAIGKVNSLGTNDVTYTTIDSDIQDIDASLATQALRKVSQSLSAAEKAQVLTNLGISSVRNITISDTEPTSSQGSDGDIWLVYET